MTRRHPLRETLLKWLVHRHLPLIGMLSGMLIGLPVLWTGWGPSDDVLQRSIILTQPLPVILTRLFVFLDPAVNASQMDLGSFPWWTYEPARVIFFRPIAALSLWLDYQLWPNSSLLMHPFSAGEKVQLTGVTYTVLSLTEDDRPQVVRVIFDRSLEDASLRWYWWDWSRSSYQPFILPAVGESVTVSGPY